MCTLGPIVAPLTDYAAKYGGASALPTSIQTTARYTEAGLMGDGEWHGLPTYGEYVFVYDN